MSDLRERAASILNGATGGRDSWSKWDREVFDVVNEAADEIERLQNLAYDPIGNSYKANAVELHARAMKMEVERDAVRNQLVNAEAEDERLRAVCHALGDKLVNEQWQPIETAPRKANIPIELWHVRWKCPVPARYIGASPNLPWVELTLTTQWPEEAFTHWRPLSQPPSYPDDQGTPK